jgi:dihydrodiol dehydrogenase / D-xylose 1-dehydrogenase (NADP)
LKKNKKRTKMSDEKLKLNWGILAAGKISQDFCSAVQTLDPKHHTVEGIAARKLESAQQFATRFNIKTAFQSYDDLIKSPLVNIIYIGTLNPSHKELSLKCIEAGKHVLCEKPMALNKVDQEEVLTAAKQKGVFFMEGMWSRFFPVYDIIRSELHNKSIGNVKFVSANFMVPINEVERVKDKELGGGVTYE